MTRPKSCRYVIHHDKHEIFAIQSYGKKRWKFWPPSTYLPLDIYTGYADHPCDKEPLVIEAQAGDVVYIPSGWRHEAEAIDGTSIHFSVGIRFKRWVDLMRDGVEENGAHRDIYRDVPPMTITEDGFFYRKPDVSTTEFLFRICHIDKKITDHYNGGPITGNEIVKRTESEVMVRGREDGNPMKSRFDR